MTNPRYPNARMQLVHLRGAEAAEHFLISSDLPGFRAGTRVHVQLPDGSWYDGVVDNRPTARQGGPIMVTLDNVPAH